MSLEILGIYKNNKIERSNIDNKHILNLSNQLFCKEIEHIIINDTDNKICIMILKDMPSLLMYNESDNQWEYLARYTENDDSEPIIADIFIIKNDNNLHEILNFIDTILKSLGGY